MGGHGLGRILRVIAGGMALVAVTPAYTAGSEDANRSQNERRTAWAVGGQPNEGSFIARAAPLPLMQPEVPSPRKESCLSSVEGVHKVTRPFRAPAKGVLDVRMDDLSGDWDLYVLTETGEFIGASEGSQVLEEAHGEEGLMVHLEPHQPVDIVACNWLGEPQVTVRFAFHRTFAPPEGLVVYATCPGTEGPNLMCVEPEAGSIPAEADAEVFTLTATGRPRRVTHNDLREFGFTVRSPDGGRAAGFARVPVHEHRNACGLYTLGLRTGETNRLIAFRGRNCPRPNDWSSDGKWILFVPDSEESRTVYKIRPNGRELTSLTNHDWDTWADDPHFVGRDIVYLASGGIVRMDAHGRNKRWLKRGCVSRLTVSPDDRWIAYSCRPSPEVEGPYILYLMRSGGSTSIRIHRGPHFINDLVFSPDGTKIAFGTWSDGTDRLRVYDLDADTLLDMPLPKETDYLHDVTWSPSGTYVAYSVAVDIERGSAAYFARVGEQPARAYRMTKASWQHSLFTWLPRL